MRGIVEPSACLAARLGCLWAIVACGGDDTAADEPADPGGSTSRSDDSGAPTSATTTMHATGESAPDPTAPADDDDDDTTATAGGMGATFDVGRPDTDTGGVVGHCQIGDDGDGFVPCVEQAPPESFTPVLQWSWSGFLVFDDSIVTPLVANLTDDDGDGDVDLCDIPDVLVTVNAGQCTDAHLFVLDGATGNLHFEIVAAVARASTPAIGDIDGDGLPEILAQTGSLAGCSGNAISAFEHDGTPKWTTSLPQLGGEHAIALADLDNDADVEIMIADIVLDHDGTVLHDLFAGELEYWTTTTAADLDADGDLEVVLGSSAFHHDGTLAWGANVAQGHPAVGDLDEDGQPEVVLIQWGGFTMLEHDGTVKYGPINPTNADWRRPATIHDLDGDGVSEFAASSSSLYTSYEGDATINWSMPVSDQSGLASGTAFDFLGDGVAEAIYADEDQLWVFDGFTGAVQMQVARGSVTIVEYPVVADLDNDGSAEIVVVTNHDLAHPVVQVFRDAEDRWIQARRIWNQHTYHVTNVREDATIPQFETPHWQQLNTFRTNAQIESGAVCRPAG